MSTINIRRPITCGGGVYETDILDEFTLFGERFAVHEAETLDGVKGYFNVTHVETSGAVLSELRCSADQAKTDALIKMAESGKKQVKEKIAKAREYWKSEGQ